MMLRAGGLGLLAFQANKAGQSLGQRLLRDQDIPGP
jgi:hypothetical protein